MKNNAANRGIALSSEAGVRVDRIVSFSGKRSCRLALARLIAFVLGALATQAAQAVCTLPVPPDNKTVCLANQPITSATTIKPNIMFILDNSGSMDRNYMPDTATSTQSKRRNFQYNTIYYDPNFNYTEQVPKNALGVSLGSQSWPKAKDNPFSSISGDTDLSQYFRAFGSDAAQAAYYCKYTGSGTGTAGTPCDDAGYVYVKVSTTSCVVSGDVKACPTGADERVNFANWYSYFRTRILLMKSSMATAFATIDDGFRVGFHTINSPASAGVVGGSLNVVDFSGGAAGTNKGKWYDMLFSMAPSGGTPLQTALDRVGQYYSGSPVASSGLSGDPVQYSCQRNYAILSTDGYWNGTTAFLDVGDEDATVPEKMPIRYNETVYDAKLTGLTEKAAFPAPYVDKTGTKKSLADVAMKYWIADLRVGAPLNKSNNNVAPTSADPAYWQHMSTYTIGLGVDGTLANTEATWAKIKSGDTAWPAPKADGPTAIDDLWHAAVNGRGQYFVAKDAASLSEALSNALRDIGSASTYGAGPASSTNDFKSPGQNDFTTYFVSYKLSDWSGNVAKYNVDRTTGLKTGLPIWSAARELDKLVNPDLKFPVSTTGYLNRNVVTMHSDGKAIPFTYADLSGTQQEALCYKASGSCVKDDTSLVDWIRGAAAYEGKYGDAGKRYRLRRDETITKSYVRELLGSIINAKPTYVGVEARIYQDASDPGYADFMKSTKSRLPVLYVPANDGMVHAFDAADGKELWAYIPSFLISQGSDEDGKERGLRALSYQWGGAPAYVQHYYIDAAPELAAVDFARAGMEKKDRDKVDVKDVKWRNILVGGLGKGGKGYYALDVSRRLTTLAEAKAAVLWEFPSASNATHKAVIDNGQMGFSYGRPIIAKTSAWGWVVIVSSGYNNKDGYGYLFVLNPTNGDLLETLKTTALTNGGMAQVTFLANSANKFVTQAYAGDLYGQLWRFDFSGDLSPRVSMLYSSSSDTPITAEPTVAVDGNNGYRWIFFGTGKYLDVADRATEKTQNLIGLRDGTASVPKSWAGPATKDTLTTVSSLTVGLTNAPDVGWIYAMDKAAYKRERVVMKAVADLRTVIFVSMIPDADPCLDITANVYGLDYSTAASRLVNSDGKIMESKFFTSAITGSAIQMPRQSTATSSSGAPQATVCSAKGECISIKLDPGKLSSATRHVGWREIIDEY